MLLSGGHTALCYILYLLLSLLFSYSSLYNFTTKTQKVTYSAEESQNRTFYHREHKEHGEKNNLAGEFSPRPPILQKTKEHPRGSRGETPSPATFFSVSSVSSVVKSPYFFLLLFSYFFVVKLIILFNYNTFWRWCHGIYSVGVLFESRDIVVAYHHDLKSQFFPCLLYYFH
jgi:hypothetical protein